MAFIEPMHRNKPNITYLLRKSLVLMIVLCGIVETSEGDDKFSMLLSMPESLSLCIHISIYIYIVVTFITGYVYQCSLYLFMNSMHQHNVTLIPTRWDSIVDNSIDLGALYGWSGIASYTTMTVVWTCWEIVVLSKVYINSLSQWHIHYLFSYMT